MATNLLAQIERLWANLRGLGVRRLSALALIGVAVFATMGLAGYYLSRPTMETLYSGLDRDDIAAIGAALREAGVPFDVNAESTVVLTPAGQAAAARMILAEKGLPRSGAIGNELYDKLGSLGLTSFMQDVTRLRALEGELARTIQMMRTVKAARVHIVLADEGSFRRERQPSSASVVIRTDGGDDRATGQAIRHLVASAVPGMKLEDVTVLNVDGSLLAYGADSVEKSPDNLLALEKEVSQQIRENVSRTLTPYLSAQNFQISVAARLNADKTQTNETIYNPDSRVERSVRVTKEQQSSQNAAGEQPAGVEANLPKPKATSGESKQSNDQTQKREELTNYEVSSKSIQTTSAGFVVQNLSVAVLINRAALAASLGGKPSADAIAAQVQEIEQLVASAAGLNRERGDAVKVAVVDFVEFEPRPRAGAGTLASRDCRPAGGIDLQRRGHRRGCRDAALVRSAARHEAGLRSSARRRNRGFAQLIRQSRPRVGGAGRRQSARRKHPHRDRSGPRRIHAGAARAARQRPRAQAHENDRIRRESRRHDPQTMDSSRSERMKPLSIADYLDRLGSAAGENGAAAARGLAVSSPKPAGPAKRRSQL